MKQNIFDLQKHMIAYDNNWRASPVQPPLDELDSAAVCFLIGTVDFFDDDSVHANQWERHPDGDEMLCVLEGRLAAVIEREGTSEEVVIDQGQTFLMPRGCWHRLRALEPGRLLFFTPTTGIELRPLAAADADVPA